MLFFHKFLILYKYATHTELRKREKTKLEEDERLQSI